MRIDTKLVNPLRTLSPLTVPDPAPRNNLAFRNLLRANMLTLATGQQMVTFLKGKGVTLTKLTKAQIRDGNNGADLAALNTAQRNALLTNTPLWFYILREAEMRTKASWAAWVPGSSRRRFTAQSRAAPSRSCATRRFVRASARITPPSAWSTCSCSPSMGK